RDNGGWGQIELPEGTKTLKKGDKNPAVAQLRKRLFLGGDLKSDSGSDEFDNDLENAVKTYQTRHYLNVDGKVTAHIVKDVNIPVEARVKTIIVNMERCRWLSPDIFKAPEFISVNIPSYKLHFTRNGKTALESNVV